MCIHNQVKGLCTKGCKFAHAIKSKLSNKNETKITAKFRLIYKELKTLAAGGSDRFN